MQVDFLLIHMDSLYIPLLLNLQIRESSLETIDLLLRFLQIINRLESIDLRIYFCNSAYVHTRIKFLWPNFAFGL